MKKILLVLTLVMIVGFSWAQRLNRDQYTVRLNGNSISPPANFQAERKSLQAEAIKKAPSEVLHFILQFNSLPTIAEQKLLKSRGINLLDYLHGNAYFASVSSRFYSTGIEESKNIRSLMKISPDYKIDQDLAAGQIPEYAKVAGNRIKVVITWFEDVDETMVANELSKMKASNVKMMEKFHQFSAEIASSDLDKLALLEWIQNIELIAPPLQLDNDHGKNLHRANVISSSIPGLGYGLTGKGVTVGLWDADVENHRDFNGRVKKREYEMHTTDHGTHTCGTITGAGLLDPKARGMAPDATVYAWNFNSQSNGLINAQERLLSLDNDGIEITSNSFGSKVSACPNPYSYNSSDRNDDLIAGWYPYFLYVYSAGNDQPICPGGFNTTSKNLKNSLIVAAIDQTDKMSSFSSFGPSKDGRLIPNISGDGVGVYSTFFDNGYGYMDGTSMATPGVAGTMALIYQRYKDTHGGARPASSFLRALACNTATDFGNPGPDYKFGYGAIDGLKAVEVMERNTYFVDNIGPGTAISKTITVPAGAVGLKVMLAWTDAAGTAGSSRILVNDLDLSVSNGGTTILPWVLNPANPSAIAVRNFDGLNNMEQVTLSNPSAGTYTINVDGYEIPTGEQEFAVVYEIVMPSLRLTYPIGGEFLTPGNQESIHWDCEGYNKTFTLEYSIDGGVNYTAIASNLAPDTRSYLWTVPAGTTNNARIRISNGSVLNVDKVSFNVMPVPQNVNVSPAQCGGAGPFTMQWDVVANAKYDILKLNGQVYEHLADAATNSYDITAITQNNNNWYCVRAIDLTTGAISQRSLAVTVNPTVSIATLPFTEKFESQKAANFFFSAVKGQGNVRFVNNSQQYGIRLEGTSGATTDWVAGTGAACFTNNPNYIVKASICNIDATSLAGKNFRLKFDFREKYRTATGTSFFRVKVNGDILTNTDGTQIYGAANQVSYKSVYYDLKAYAGLASVAVEFEAVCKTNYTTYVDATSGNYDFSNDTYDVGDFVTIDNIQISEPLDGDLSITSITPGTGLTNAEAITVKVKNLSGSSVSNIPVSYTINSGAAVNEVVAGPIAPMAEETYVFNQKADFSVGGVYTVVASVNWLNDPVAGNNKLSANKANNGTDILIGTASPTTTCSGIITDPSGRFADYAALQSKIHTIIPGEAGKNTKVTFTGFATEKDYDYVYIYDGPTIESPLLGKFSGSTLPPSFTSSAAGGELTLEFTSDEGVNDKGFVATLACVDKPNIDMAVTAITKPTLLPGIKTATEQIQFTAKNNGMQAAASYIAHYQIDNNTTVDQTFTTGLAPAASETSTFTTSADLSAPGTHALKVWVEIADDALAANNQQTATIVSQASLSDAGISAVNAIVPTRANLSTIAATISNFGTLPISNFDVAYKINDAAEVTQTVSGPIAAGATAAVTFTTKADLTALNTTYNIEVYTKLAGDVQADNDKTTSVSVTPNIPATNVVGSFKTGNAIATSSNTTPFSLTNNFTVEFWLKPDTNPKYGTLFSKGLSIIHHSEYYPEAYGANVLMISLGGQLYKTPPNSITNNVWQHVAVTSSADGTIKVFINGEEQTLSNSTKANQSANLATPVRLGSNSNYSQPYYGGMDEVRIWNSCLSQATIASNSMIDYAANTEGLLAYYKFKEGAGSRYLYDYSSKENTALVANSDISGMGTGKFWNTPGLLLTDLNIAGEKVPTTFDATTSTFTSIMDAANLSSLVANFTPVMSSEVKIGTTVQSAGVTTNDFSAGTLTYTAEGSGFNNGIIQNYTVNVSNDLSNECEMSAYSFETADNPGLSGSIVLDANGNNYYKKVASGMDLTSLKARFTVSPNANVLINGVKQTNPQAVAIDYSNPVMVTVMAANGRTFKNYNITVDARSSNADLTAFNIPDEQVGTSKIDAINHTIGIWVKISTDLSMLAPTYAISSKANVFVNNVIQTNSITSNDFTNPLVYKVVSEDESTSVDWTITVANDAVKPVITLAGDATMTVAYGSSFNDPGATATDNVDGTINSSIVVTGAPANTSPVGIYTIKYNVTDAAGNNAVEVVRMVNITKAPLTATANKQTKAYGEANPDLTITYSGFVNNETPAVLNTIPTASTTIDATSAAGIHTGAITVSGGITDNYDFTYVSADFTVTKAPLTVTAANQTKAYGEANPDLAYTYSGFVNGETATDLNTEPAATTTIDEATAVGKYIGDIILTGGDANNYDFTYVPGDFSVTKASLIVTADNQTKVYGESNPDLTYTYSGFVNGETESDLNTEPDATTTVDETTAVGEYIGDIILTDGDADNYEFTYVSGDFSVTKASLTATADNQTKVYGDSNPALTISYSGFVNGETASDLNTEPAATTTIDEATAVGEYIGDITITDGDADNYDFTYLPGDFSVTKAPLTATANKQTKAYGEANPALTITYSGFANGETSAVLTTLPTASTTIDATTASGVHTGVITVAGGIADNYDFTYAAADFTVTKASLTVTAVNKTKVYGAENPALTITYSGFVNSETSAVLTTLPTASTAIDATTASGVHTGAITVSGGVADNYDFTYVVADFTITKAPLTVTAAHQTKVYGKLNPALSVSYSGFVNGETSAVLTTQPTASTTIDATTASGAHTGGIDVAGGIADNYDFTYVSGDFSVTKAPLTATANKQTKVYGAENPALTITYSGFANGETYAVLTTLPIASTTIDATTASGVHTGVITLAGGIADNYDFTYAAADFTVTKASAAITITNLSPYFNGSPRAVTVTTVPEGLDVTVTYDGSATAPTNAGSYAVVATVNDANYEGTKSESFVIVPNTGIDPHAGEAVQIYSDGTAIYVRIGVIKTKAHLSVNNILGTSVYQTSNLTEGLNKIDGNIISGVYIVRLDIDNKTVSRKIMLKNR